MATYQSGSCLPHNARALCHSERPQEAKNLSTSGAALRFFVALLLSMTITDVILREPSDRRISVTLTTGRSFVAPPALLRMTSHTHRQCLSRKVTALLRMTSIRVVLASLHAT